MKKRKEKPKCFFFLFSDMHLRCVGRRTVEDASPYIIRWAELDGGTKAPP